MGLFKRKSKQPAATTPTVPQTTGQRGRTPAPPAAQQDEYFGDTELRDACEAMEAGDWEQADVLLDERGEDGWTDSKICRAASVETAMAWESQKPSGRSTWVLGSAQIDAAWDIRGSGPGAGVSWTNQTSFAGILAESEQTLRRSIELDDTLAMPWRKLLAVGMGLGKPIEERQQVLDEAFRRVPFHADTVWAATQALAGKWGGTNEGLLEFGRWVESEAPEGHPSRMALPIVNHENAFQAGYMAQQQGQNFLVAYSSALDNDELFLSLERLLGAISEIAPPALVTALNYHLFVSAPDRAGAADTHLKLLKAIDNRSTEHPWGLTGKPPRDDFLEYQQRMIRFSKMSEVDHVAEMMTQLRRRADSGEEIPDDIMAILLKYESQQGNTAGV